MRRALRLSSPPQPDPITPSPISSTITWWLTFQRAEEGVGQRPLGLKRTKTYLVSAQKQRIEGSGGERLCCSRAHCLLPNAARKNGWEANCGAALTGVVGTAGLATEKGGLDSSWPATKNESQSSFYNMSNTSHVTLHFSTNYWCLSAFSELHSARTSFVWLSVNSSLHVCSPVAAKNQTSRRCEKTRDEFPVECPSVRYLAAVSASHAHPRHGPCAGPSPPVHSVPVRIWIVCRLRGRTVRVGDCVRTGGSDRRPSGLPVCFVQLGGHQGRDPSVRVSPPEHLCHLRPDRAHRWPGSAEPDPRACNINWRWV